MSASGSMTATPAPIEYADASAEVRAVYDDIMATRKTDWVNNYWKALAHHPPSLRRMWANAKEVMGPGALDPLQVLHRLARRSGPRQGLDAATTCRAGGHHRARE
jgi:hypothetical protein